MSEARLIESITRVLEEYGMVKFKDNIPARDILQMVKDAGYSLNAGPTILERLALDKKNVHAVLNDVHYHPVNEMLADAIMAKFSPAGVTEETK